MTGRIFQSSRWLADAQNRSDSKTKDFVMMDTHHPAADAIEHFRLPTTSWLRASFFPAMNTCIRVSLGTPPGDGRVLESVDVALPYSHGMKM